MGRGPDHDHTLMARSDLVPRDCAPSNSANKEVHTIKVALMECTNQEAIPFDCLEAHITICSQICIREDIARKVTDSWTKGTKQNYQQMFKQWCSFWNERRPPVLKVFVSNLVEYLHHLQVTHDYAYTTLGMNASAICSILQLTKQTRASTSPLFKQLLKGMFRKKPPSRVLANTWDTKKVLDLLHAWGKPSVMNYTCLTLKTVVILALAKPQSTGHQI